MSRLYANENMPLPVVEELRRLGHDVLTTLDAGNAGKSMPDEAALEFAIAHKRILITLNRKHFIRLHAQNSNHYGIIVCSLDVSFGAQASRVHEALQETCLMNGKLIRINRPS